MKSKKSKIALGLIALFFALKWWFAAPSEVDMKRRFVEHRAEFEELRTMVQHDAPFETGGLHISQTYAESDEGGAPSSARVERYRVLMSTLGIQGIDGGKSHFRMYVFGGGFTDTSWSIGYAFSKQVPKNLVASAYITQSIRDNTVYSSLSHHWYFYQSR